MKLQIQLVEQDYVDAALSVATPTAGYIAVTCALLVGALGVASFYAANGHVREAIIGFSVLLGALTGSAVEQRLTIPRKARKVFCQQRLSKPFELGWTDRQISVVSADGSFTKPWSEIWKARLLSNEILLFLSDVNFLMVPKRCFPDASTLLAFENLLGQVTKFG
jgi:hypothetical protein